MARLIVSHRQSDSLDWARTGPRIPHSPRYARRLLAGYIIFGIGATFSAVMLGQWTRMRLAARKAKRGRRW
jgi:hypothetical protein